MVFKKIKEYLYDHLLKLKHILAQEGKETKHMLEVYLRFTRGKAEIEEMKQANDQFKDLLKSAGLGVFIVLPFAPVTIPLVVKFARKIGVELLPNSIREQLPKNKQ